MGQLRADEIKNLLYSALAVFGTVAGLYEYPLNQTYGAALLIIGGVFMLAWSQAFWEYIKP